MLKMLTICLTAKSNLMKVILAADAKAKGAEAQPVKFLYLASLREMARFELLLFQMLPPKH